MEHLNQIPAATVESDKVGSGLAPKNPTIGQDRRAPLPHAISGIDVDANKRKPSKTKKDNAPTPAVPEDVTRKVRRGATIAMILAAGISARTLFQLGEIIGLPWQFAWMLPGAFDVYAYTSATVAASVPATHPARKWAVWNARIALSFTMIGNSLVHALFLMSHGQGWTGTDYALTAVSAIPPIIVERLLHLQTKIAAEAPAAAGEPAPASGGSGKKPAAEKAAPATTPAPAFAPAPAMPPAAPAAATTAAAAADDGTETSEQGGTVVPLNGNGRRSPAAWAELALPHVRVWVDHNPGAELTGPIVGRLLREAHPDLPVPAGPRSERNIRAAVETLLTAPSKDATNVTDEDSEEAEAVS